MSIEVLTPESPRWVEFCNRLSVAVFNPGCDGDEIQAGPAAHRYAKEIMADMGNIDIQESIALFKSLGGFCDCEILFNVDGWI